jgi:hypothetical protein
MASPKEKESELTGADTDNFFIRNFSSWRGWKTEINHTTIIQTCTNDFNISYNNGTYHYDSKYEFHEIKIMIYSVRNKFPKFSW